MKKVLFWVLPLFIVACSLFSYQISKDYILQIKGGTKPLSIQDKSIIDTSTNRPKIQSSLYSKTVIVVNNGIDSNSFYSFAKTNLPDYWKNCVYGTFQNEPVNDPKQALFMLLSGSVPSQNGIKNSLDKEKLDDLVVVAKENKKNTILFSNLDFGSTEKDQSDFNQIMANWKKYDLIIFDFNNQTNLTKWKNDYLDPILKNLSNTDLFFFCSLIPENKAHPFIKLSKYYQSPYLISANNLDSKISPLSSNNENITATLAFSMGLSLPSDCLGYPELNFFTIPDKDKISRGYSSVINFIVNSVRLLYQYNINETFIAGYLMESIDSVDLSPAKTTENMHQQYLSIKQELQSYTNETRQRTNLTVSLILLFLFLVFLVIWLLLLVKYYRGYIFGLCFILIFLVFHYFVFRIPVSFPKDSLFSLRWFLFHSSVPLFISAILTTILYTIFSGYVFDITLSNIFEDLNCIVGTFGLFILGEITYIVNFYGFNTQITSPGYFLITFILRDFSLLILISITLLLMYGISFITFKLLTKYGPKPNI